MRETTTPKSRAKGHYSRIVQVSLQGSILKKFDEECIREESGESSTGRDLIREALQAREIKRQHKKW